MMNRIKGLEHKIEARPASPMYSISAKCMEDSEDVPSGKTFPRDGWRMAEQKTPRGSVKFQEH